MDAKIARMTLIKSLAWLNNMIHFIAVCCQYGNEVMALSLNQIKVLNKKGETLFSPLTFEIQAGEIWSLMGPSGCGKSTLLDLIAGHLSADFTYSGQVLLHQKCLNEIPAHCRGVGILFQDDLLFPHLTVIENLAFALPNHYKRQARKEKSSNALAAIELAHLAHVYPNQLSGGQSARISLTRMLLAEPQLVLLDEPFSKLDKTLRVQFRDWVFQQLKQANLPALMVTHDEADIPQHGKVLHWPWHLTSEDSLKC